MEVFLIPLLETKKFNVEKREGYGVSVFLLSEFLIRTFREGEH